jgi:hypothetical protein
MISAYDMARILLNDQRTKLGLVQLDAMVFNEHHAVERTIESREYTYANVSWWRKFWGWRK